MLAETPCLCKLSMRGDRAAYLGRPFRVASRVTLPAPPWLWLAQNARVSKTTALMRVDAPWGVFQHGGDIAFDPFLLASIAYEKKTDHSLILSEHEAPGSVMRWFGNVACSVSYRLEGFPSAGDPVDAQIGYTVAEENLEKLYRHFGDAQTEGLWLSKRFLPQAWGGAIRSITPFHHHHFTALFYRTTP